MTGLPDDVSEAEPGLLRARPMAERSHVVASEPAVAAKRGRISSGHTFNRLSLITDRDPSSESESSNR